MKTLKEFLDNLVTQKDLKPIRDPDGVVKKTWCNFGADRVAVFMGYDGLHDANGAPYLANKQFDILSQSRRFVPCSMAEAAKQAQSGHLVFAAAKLTGHGHICAVYPAPPKASGSWGADVPMVANIGPKNEITTLSWAFKKSDNPSFFVYVG